MKTALVAAGLLFFALQGHARPQGGVDGGGGKSVVCRNSKGQITSAQTLDLFEAKDVYNLKLTSFSGSVDEISAKVQAKMATSSGVGGYDYKPFYSRVNKIMKFAPLGDVIKPIDDAAEVVVPKNCKLEQLAHYVDDDTLLVSQEIWNHLSNTEKAALISHEAVYRVDRAFGAKDSRRARKIVALMFSDFAFENVTDGVPVNAKTCTAKMGDRMTYQFSYFPSKDGKSTTMQFQWFDGKPVFTKKTVNMPIRLPWLKNLSNRCDGGADCKVSEGTLVSKFEGSGSLQVGHANFPEGKYNREMFYFNSETGKHTLDCYPGSDDNVVTLQVTQRPLYLIPGATVSCLANRMAMQNGTSVVPDVPAAYFRIPMLLFKQTDPRQELYISKVDVNITSVDGRAMTCSFGGDTLAALHSQWWSRNDKDALIPAGIPQFGTDCPVVCGGFDINEPFAGTGFVKVYGYQQSVDDENDATGLTLTAPITIGNF